MNKEMKYFSIGEVAKLFNMPVKTIRYYDEIGLLKPAYVDPQTNYRFYGVDQFVLIDMIRNAKQMGMSLKAIQALIEDDLKIEAITDLIDKQVDFIQRQIDELERTKVSMKQLHTLIKRTIGMKQNTVFIEVCKAERFYSYPLVSHTIEEQEIHFRQALTLSSGEVEVYAVFGCSTSAELYFKEGKFLNPDIRHYFRSETEGIDEEVLPEGKYACIIFDDNSFHKERYYHLLATYIEENKIEIQGDFVEQWIMPRVEGKRESTLVKLKIKIKD